MNAVLVWSFVCIVVAETGYVSGNPTCNIGEGINAQDPYPLRKTGLCKNSLGANYGKDCRKAKNSMKTLLPSNEDMKTIFDDLDCGYHCTYAYGRFNYYSDCTHYKDCSYESCVCDYSSCFQCPPNTYSLGGDRALCQPCPEGKISMQGASMCFNMEGL